MTSPWISDDPPTPEQWLIVLDNYRNLLATIAPILLIALEGKVIGADETWMAETMQRWKFAWWRWEQFCVQHGRPPVKSNNPLTPPEPPH